LPAEGDLASTRVSRLLATLHAARASGELSLVRGHERRLVSLEQGRPVFAASNERSESFAARCLREGVLSPDALYALLAELNLDEPLDEELIARGIIDSARRSRLMADQVREVVWGAFAWRSGRYRLQGGRAARGSLPVSLPVEVGVPELVLEGTRRTAALEELRRELPARLALAAKPVPAYLGDLVLPPPEVALLAHADGTKTVGDLVTLSGMGEREALAVLQALLDLGLLAEVRRSLAGTRRMGFM
jgi:hypothetical protein